MNGRNAAYNSHEIWIIEINEIWWASIAWVIFIPICSYFWDISLCIWGKTNRRQVYLPFETFEIYYTLLPMFDIRFFTWTNRSVSLLSILDTNRTVFFNSSTRIHTFWCKCKSHMPWWCLYTLLIGTSFDLVTINDKQLLLSIRIFVFRFDLNILFDFICSPRDVHVVDVT